MILNLILGKVFLEVPRIAPVMANQALYWIDSSLWWKDIFKFDRREYHHNQGRVWQKLDVISADLVAGYVIFGEIKEFCLFLKIPFLDAYQILTWSQV